MSRVRLVKQIRLCHIDNRMAEVAQRHVDFADDIAMLSKCNRCKQCYMQQSYCICTKLRDLGCKSGIGALKCHVYLYTHYKEYGKSSNTGKLMRIGFPNSVSILIYGLPAHEELLNEKIMSENTLILYPGMHSISLSEVRDKIIYQKPSLTSNSNPYNLIIIDSTWSQSKAMYRRLISIKAPSMLSTDTSTNNMHANKNNNESDYLSHYQPLQLHPQPIMDNLKSMGNLGNINPWLYNVHVDKQLFEQGPSQFDNRKQIMPSKASTIESIACAFSILDENISIKDYCKDALLLSVFMNKLQAGKI